MKLALYISDRLLFLILICVMGAAALRIHLAIESTVIGYKLGRLKESESQLLEKRSQLIMQHAKMTTRQALTKYSENEPRVRTAEAE